MGKTRYIEYPERICPTCGRELVVRYRPTRGREHVADYLPGSISCKKGLISVCICIHCAQRDESVYT